MPPSDRVEKPDRTIEETMIRIPVFRLTWLAALAVPALAAAPRPAATAPAPCSAPECRQFDFWIGDWDVQKADGSPAGTNRVEKILGDCVLQENWKGAKGSEGRSFNLWDATDRRWHQTWVDDQGTRLVLEGGFENGRMVLSGESPTSNGTRALNRITWTPHGADRVEQHWEVSVDGGKTWSDAFWGLYVRRNGGAGK
jgi:hypothetical protein